jgi:anthranilate phosphoribosyltransferase
MIREVIGKVLQDMDLTEEEALLCALDIIEGRANHAQIAALLVALRKKGVTIDEMVGATRAFRSHLPLVWDGDEVLVLDREEINIDEETISKTMAHNGMRTRTFTVSTATAFVAAACGVNVAKSGTLPPTERVGGGQVLRALGIEITMSRSQIQRSMGEARLSFLYTPLLQGPWRNTYEVRRQLGFRTLLNEISPLCNPMGGRWAFLGVYDPDKVAFMGEVVMRLGFERATIVHGDDTLDEVSITGRTLICEVDEAGLRTRVFVPEEVGLRRSRTTEISGGDAVENARIIRMILEGERGPKRDLVVLNTAFALMTAGRAATVEDGLHMAETAIDSGEAIRRLEMVAGISREKALVRDSLGPQAGAFP